VDQDHRARDTAADVAPHAELHPQFVRGKRDFHSLRSSYISHLADRGLAVHEVQRLARHSDIKTTQGYMTPTADLAKRAARLLPDLPAPRSSS
jgi:site-specific recombinase XerD